ncbi:MAG: hypothetical protein NZM04_00575 [Methylacidiphilales bacterium]|nr:hypothetical protein [Candidatus Methylacidiphilales bacterium]
MKKHNPIHHFAQSVVDSFEIINVKNPDDEEITKIVTKLNEAAEACIHASCRPQDIFAAIDDELARENRGNNAVDKSANKPDSAEELIFNTVQYLVDKKLSASKAIYVLIDALERITPLQEKLAELAYQNKVIYYNDNNLALKAVLRWKYVPPDALDHIKNFNIQHPVDILSIIRRFYKMKYDDFAFFYNKLTTKDMSYRYLALSYYEPEEEEDKRKTIKLIEDLSPEELHKFLYNKIKRDPLYGIEVIHSLILAAQQHGSNDKTIDENKKPNILGSYDKIKIIVRCLIENRKNLGTEGYEIVEKIINSLDASKIEQNKLDDLLQIKKVLDPNLSDPETWAKIVSNIKDTELILLAFSCAKNQAECLKALKEYAIDKAILIFNKINENNGGVKLSELIDKTDSFVSKLSAINFKSEFVRNILSNLIVFGKQAIGNIPEELKATKDLLKEAHRENYHGMSKNDIDRLTTAFVDHVIDKGSQDHLVKTLLSMPGINDKDKARLFKKLNPLQAFFVASIMPIPRKTLQEYLRNHEKEVGPIYKSLAELFWLGNSIIPVVSYRKIGQDMWKTASEGIKKYFSFGSVAGIDDNRSILNLVLTKTIFKEMLHIFRAVVVTVVPYRLVAGMVSAGFYMTRAIKNNASAINHARITYENAKIMDKVNNIQPYIQTDKNITGMMEYIKN